MLKQETRTSADNSHSFLAIYRRAGEQACNFTIKAVKLVKRHGIPICMKFFNI